MALETYPNLSGNSGITRYELGEDWISVEFRGGDVYLYDYSSTGEIDVEEMKRLAQAGRGLSSFIARHVRRRYARKL